ncbi:MAG: hypothetical protein EOM59_15525 [Clostridia bacterium]|nr:hypothetical protein [Clostridia bacterium]
MIQVTQDKWDSIPKEYKGVFSRKDFPEYKGKKTVLSGCISNEVGSLLIEGVHFEITAPKAPFGMEAVYTCMRRWEFVFPIKGTIEVYSSNPELRRDYV